MTSARSIEQEQVCDRREGERQILVLQLGIIESGVDHLPGLVLDIGAGGLRFKMFSSSAVIPSVRIKLKGGRNLSGRLAWQDGALLGLVFDKPLSQGQLDDLLLTMARGRSPRLQTDLKCLLRSGSQTHVVHLSNISLRGAGIDIGDIKLPFRSIHLRLPGMGVIDGQLCWKRDGKAGIVFNETLNLKHLSASIMAHGVS